MKTKDAAEEVTVIAADKVAADKDDETSTNREEEDPAPELCREEEVIVALDAIEEEVIAAEASGASNVLDGRDDCSGPCDEVDCPPLPTRNCSEVVAKDAAVKVEVAEEVFVAKGVDADV